MPEDNDDTRPRPDPTVLTTQQMHRAVQAERDYVDGKIAVLEERLRAIDTATKLLNETVNRTPTDIQKEITHQRDWSEEKFASIRVQFQERDTRQEREARDNKVAVDAAFAAQKEAAAKQDESNQKAIDKSERATNETIKTMAELFRSTSDAIKERVTSTELQISSIMSTRQGGQDNKDRSIAVIAAVVGVVGVLLILGGIIISITLRRG